MNPTPVILEVALSTSPQRNPHAPTTLAELTKDGLACIDAGASIVHMHLPDLHVPADEATRQYLSCFEPWRAHSPDILPLPTNGFGDSMEDRFAHQFLLNDAGALHEAVDLCGRLGRPVATPTQAGEILGLQRRRL